MAIKGPGVPYATPWKNYQLPWTRLTDGKGLKDVVTVNLGLDIYINDDILLDYPRTTQYTIGMQNDIGGDFFGAGTSTYERSMFWIDGTSGTYTSTGNKIRLGLPDNISDRHGKAMVNVVSPEVESDYSRARGITGSTGNGQEIITIEPGLHFGFQSDSPTAHATSDRVRFSLDSDYIQSIPKDYNNVWTSWMYVPISGDDITLSQNLPSELQLKSFSVHVNPIRFGPKQLFTDILGGTAKDFGLSWYLQRKSKGQDWAALDFEAQHVIIGTADKDYSAGEIDRDVATMHFPSMLSGAERLQDMRIAFKFQSVTLSEATMILGQYLQVVIVPH